jgi:4-hydroxybenzoate polyprenyltransferase
MLHTDESHSGHAVSAARDVPLVVDVDGTLIKTDLLYETALQFVASFPFQIWRLPLWFVRGGKAGLKTNLARYVAPDLSTVPLRDEVLALVETARDGGRKVYLASASVYSQVKALADRIGGIAGVFATDSTINLSGQAKADRLVAEFGLDGYDYVGDAAVDFPVWRSARNALAVVHGRAFERRLLSYFPAAEIVARPKVRVVDIIRALRPHQWAKNTLVFVAIVAGHNFEAKYIIASLIAFVCFCMVASSAYLVNDLLDLPGDRAHPRKRSRPFASGAVPLSYGTILAVFLGVGGFALSLTLPVRFSAILAIYAATTLAYSFVLKRKLMVDIVVLGGLYTLRVLGGLTAIGAPYTQWLLMFSLFLFLSLAVVKRCSELQISLQDGSKNGLQGRNYRTEDLRVLLPFGAAAAYGSVLIFAMYLSSSEVAALYSYPNRLWLVCPLLIYWLSRLFLLSNRNELHDDPVVFALTDRISLLTGVCVAAVLLISL